MYSLSAPFLILILLTTSTFNTENDKMPWFVVVRTTNSQCLQRLLNFTIDMGYDVWTVNRERNRFSYRPAKNDKSQLREYVFETGCEVNISRTHWVVEKKQERVTIMRCTRVIDGNLFLNDFEKFEIKTSDDDDQRLDKIYNFVLQNDRSTSNSVDLLEQIAGNDYLSYEEFTDWAHRIKRKFRSYVKTIRLGETWQKRKMLLLKIEIPPYSSKKKALWMDGGIHGREWISPASLIYFIWTLLNNISSNEHLFKDYRLYVLPFANPDGYSISFNNRNNLLRFWRKNARPSSMMNDICSGVDLNRNFPYSWDLPSKGASFDECSEIYKGPYAGSEPEVKAITNFLTKRQKFELFISFHSYGMYWLYPWGHSVYKSLIDENEIHRLALTGSKAMRSNEFSNWKVGQSSKLLYESSGTSEDWAKGVAGIKYAYCVELPPDDDSPFEFSLPPEYIRTVGRLVYKGIIRIVKRLSSSNSTL